MLYRAVAILIVIFWLTMTGLLLRKELAPGASALKEVPASHVLKQMFAHAQTSTLHVYHERVRIGHLQIQPQVRKEDGARLLALSGNLQIAIPGWPRQRVAWDGDLVMDRAHQLQLAQFNVTFRDPAAYAVEVVVDPRAKRLRYETRAGERELDRGEYPLDQQGALTWLREQGLDPAMMPQWQQAVGPAPVLKAWQSSLEIHSQKLDTYRVALEHGGQTLIEFHVNQLGQILQGKTFLGYTVAPDDAIP